MGSFIASEHGSGDSESDCMQSDNANQHKGGISEGGSSDNEDQSHVLDQSYIDCDSSSLDSESSKSSAASVCYSSAGRVLRSVRVKNEVKSYNVHRNRHREGDHGSPLDDDKYRNEQEYDSESSDTDGDDDESSYNQRNGTLKYLMVVCSIFSFY